jgi:hypothetical protein
MDTKQPPQFNTKGTPCDIVPDCTSGKPSFYVVNGKHACADHKDVAYRLAKRGNRTPVVAPELDSFEPEIESVEVEEVEVGKLAKLIDD